jgi:hypothetical protein
MTKIIYIHHFFSKSLFYKIAHNTIDRVFSIDKTNTGFVTANYNGNEIKFIFDPIINDNEDGLHLIDFWTTYYQKDINPFYKIPIIRDNTIDINFLLNVNTLLKNKKNWIITIFRMEKIIGKYDDDNVHFNCVTDFENELSTLNNHHIVSDNFIYDCNIKTKYPNYFFCLTNTIHQWNETLSIRWYYEYKNIFEKLNQPYDLCFSIRNHRKNRIQIMSELAKLNNNKIYLSRVDNHKNKIFNNINKLFVFEKNIHNNITNSDNFDDLSWIENIEHYLDYLMRILPMSKMHILSETWDYSEDSYTSQYLSEKTYGFLLAKIPFIPTHSYPLDIIQKMLQVSSYPFYEEIKSINGNPKKFVEFVKWFMENFDANYKLCKEWVNFVHDELMQKINNENSLLDTILNNFEYNDNLNEIKKNLL